MNTYKWNLRDGREVVLEAEAYETLEPEYAYADGDRVEIGKHVVFHGNLVAYIDGKKYDSCQNENFWQVIDTRQKGIKGIWGIKRIGFTEDRAEEIRAFLDGVLEAGRPQEVRDFLRKKEEARIAKKVKEAKDLIKKAEKQPEIPSRKEALRWMRNYNEVNNEGGYGFVPYIISMEEYEDAKRTVAKYEKEA